MLILEKKPLVMGILNVTPDSFYDGGKCPDTDSALRQAAVMAQAGADIIDIGGESTRPGADSVAEEVELDRVMPVLERIKKELSVPVSVDTTKAGVAERALQAGAEMINDVSAMRQDPQMAAVIAKFNAKIVLMHMRGNPKNMQEHPVYEDVIAEISDFFSERITWATQQGVAEDNIILDPGIGFGKRLEDNLCILNRLSEFKGFGRPVLAGPSRKSFIGMILNVPPEKRVWGTAASVAIAVMNGADIVRVHDVEAMKQVARVTSCIRDAKICKC